jgi:hypothetical protein
MSLFSFILFLILSSISPSFFFTSSINPEKSESSFLSSSHSGLTNEAKFSFNDSSISSNLFGMTNSGISIAGCRSSSGTFASVRGQRNSKISHFPLLLTRCLFLYSYSLQIEITDVDQYRHRCSKTTTQDIENTYECYIDYNHENSSHSASCKSCAKRSHHIRS